MPSATINGITRVFPAGLTVLQAARQVGIDIPTLCHDARLKPAAACRLCLVQVAGYSKPVTACDTLLADNMVVITAPAELEDERRTLLTWLAQHTPAEAVAQLPDKLFHRELFHY